MSTQTTETKHTQHTAGPWTTGTPGRGRFCVYSPSHHGKGICVMSNTEQNWGADMVAKYGEHPANLEADANARLIAAAPDLLAALRSVISDYVAAEHAAANQWNPYYEPASVKRARAAIAKAEGCEKGEL